MCFLVIPPDFPPFNAVLRVEMSSDLDFAVSKRRIGLFVRAPKKNCLLGFCLVRLADRIFFPPDDDPAYECLLSDCDTEAFKCVVDKFLRR